jgi:hypothetical protein
MRYKEFGPQHTEQANQAPTRQSADKQQRPIFAVQPDQTRHAELQRKLAYDIAQDADNVEPTLIDKVKAFTHYAQMQKTANGNAQQQVVTNRQHRP